MKPKTKRLLLAAAVWLILMAALWTLARLTDSPAERWIVPF